MTIGIWIAIVTVAVVFLFVLDKLGLKREPMKPTDANNIAGNDDCMNPLGLTMSDRFSIFNDD